MNEAERHIPDDVADDPAPAAGSDGALPKERPDPITRTQRHGSEIAEWRAKVLEHRVPAWQWAVLAAFFLVLVVGALFAPMQDGTPMVGLGMLAVASVVTGLGYRSLSKQDRAVRSYAALTPVVDDAILVGEVRIVAAAADTLLKTVANPNSTEALRRLAILGVMSAAQRIMNRGGVTVETASVAGYAAWPGIERVEMPGNPGDFQTVHLLRIDASAKRMVDTIDQGGTYIAETFATMAGEVVPPARALLALMEARRTDDAPA
jgi:hypothetical protein